MLNVEVSEDVLVARLRTEDPEFKKWEEEHHKLESSLASIDSHVYLSPERKWSGSGSRNSNWRQKIK